MGHFLWIWSPGFRRGIVTGCCLHHSRQLLLSYPTILDFCSLLQGYIDQIYRDMHGSDSNTYDNEGRFVPQIFENIFSKYAKGRDYLTFRDV